MRVFILAVDSWVDVRKKRLRLMDRSISHPFVRAIWLFIFLLAVMASPCFSQVGPRPPTPKAYCGIYAVYGAIAALRMERGETMPLKIDDFLDAKYVSSFRGSTTGDLKRAAVDFGFEAKTHQFCSWRTLEVSPHPLILHVHVRGQPSVYGHWVLFLGMQDNLARIQDGRGGIIGMDASDLLSRWDGLAIEIYPPDESPLQGLVLQSNAAVPLFTVIGILIVLFGGLYNLRSRTLATEFFTLIVVICFSIPLSIFWLSETKVHESTVRGVAIDLGSLNLPIVTLEDMQAVANDSSVRLVDCRYAEDTEHGRIPRAVCVPFDASLAEIRQKTRTWGRDDPIVLYCLSPGCRFSDAIAGELARMGFSSLRIYRNGFDEWFGHGNPIEK